MIVVTNDKIYNSIDSLETVREILKTKDRRNIAIVDRNPSTLESYLIGQLQSENKNVLFVRKRRTKSQLYNFLLEYSDYKFKDIDNAIELARKYVNKGVPLQAIWLENIQKNKPKGWRIKRKDVEYGCGYAQYVFIDIENENARILVTSSIDNYTINKIFVLTKYVDFNIRQLKDESIDPSVFFIEDIKDPEDAQKYLCMKGNLRDKYDLMYYLVLFDERKLNWFIMKLLDYFS